MKCKASRGQLARLVLPLVVVAVAHNATAQPVAATEAISPSVAPSAAAIDAYFETWMAETHVPGVVYGIVRDGKLVFVGARGMQDPLSGIPVTTDSRFRIASMSKAFTALAILKLRDEGRLALDTPAERYVPELKGWRYPTTDSRKIRVADLLHHIAGFVEDNAWGDRQQPLSDEDFSRFLRTGVPFARAPGLKMEYSNLGYAILGRIITNVSGMPYQTYIQRKIMRPLGMTSTGYDIFSGPQATRALGWRWTEGNWQREPDMADGAFGAMGGVETNAADYARWIAFLLSAWPARDGPETGPVSRATVREMVEGANFVQVRDRNAAFGQPCKQALAYGSGWFAINDCDAGRILHHNGGYPGFGSNVVLLPDAGVGMFAFGNRTYSSASVPVMQSILLLRREGLAPDRGMTPSAELQSTYDAAREVWRTGDPAAAPLAMNVPLDRTLESRRADIQALKSKVGTCETSSAIVPVSAMEGRFTWPCATGSVSGRIQLAPVAKPQLQVMTFELKQ